MGDLRWVDSTGSHDELAVDMVAFKCLLDRFGARYHTRGGKHWWLTRVIPRLGSAAGTKSSVARVEEKKLSKGMALRREIFGRQPDSTASARSLLPSTSFPNFIQRIAPGGSCHLRRGWNVVNDSGVMELRRSGASSAETQVAVTEKLRD